MPLILIDEATVKLYCLLSILDAQRCLKFLVTLNTEHFLSANINGATDIRLSPKKSFQINNSSLKK